METHENDTTAPALMLRRLAKLEERYLSLLAGGALSTAEELRVLGALERLEGRRLQIRRQVLREEADAAGQVHATLSVGPAPPAGQANRTEVPVGTAESAAPEAADSPADQALQPEDGRAATLPPSHQPTEKDRPLNRAERRRLARRHRKKCRSP